MAQSKKASKDTDSQESVKISSSDQEVYTPVYIGTEKTEKSATTVLEQKNTRETRRVGRRVGVHRCKKCPQGMGWMGLQCSQWKNLQLMNRLIVYSGV